MMLSPSGAIAPVCLLIGRFVIGNNEGQGLSPSLTGRVSCLLVFPGGLPEQSSQALARRIPRRGVL